MSEVLKKVEHLDEMLVKHLKVYPKNQETHQLNTQNAAVEKNPPVFGVLKGRGKGKAAGGCRVFFAGREQRGRGPISRWEKKVDWWVKTIFEFFLTGA